GRPGSLSARRTHLRPQWAVHAGGHLVATRDASRGDSGELGFALDVAQLGAAGRLLADKRHLPRQQTRERCAAITLALLSALDCRPGGLGRGVLGPTTTDGTRHVRRAT